MGGGKKRRERVRIAPPINGTVTPDTGIPIILSPELETRTAPAVALASARAPFPLPTAELKSRAESSSV